MSQLQEALAKLEKMREQERVEVVRGFQIRKKRNGIPVLSLHYSAIPERDPTTDEGKKWFKRERKLSSSASAWNREQEIDAYAKGGEAVFAKILSDFYDVIVISDPNWYPKAEWDVVGGFDHGKRNATALLKAYVDRVNRYDWITKKPYPPDLYLCGEYYSMQRDGWDNSVRENVAQIKKMPDLDRMRWIRADPSIFPDTQAQGDTGEYSSINNTYVKCGFKQLTPYTGERSDTTFAEWMLSDFWGGVEDNVRPRLFIVCRNPSDRPQPGLHPYDCPNLLWELKRAKRVEMSARQLATKNLSDALVDKDNHCLTAGTLVACECGAVPIEGVRIGEKVWTRQGLKTVLNAWMASPAAEVYRVTFSNGVTLVGTSEHPIWIRDKGFVTIDALKYGMIASCLENMGQPKSECGWGSGSIATPKARSSTCAPTSAMGASTFTRSSGFSRTRSPFRPVITSTTLTETPVTTNLKTFRRFRPMSIWPSRAGRRIAKRVSIWQPCVSKLLNGTARQKEGRGIASTRAVSFVPSLIRRASSVRSGFRIATRRRRETSFALGAVGRAGAIRTISITSSARVTNAGKRSPARSTTRRDSAQRYAAVSVVDVQELQALQPVFDLTVADAHEFYANGILVHNCRDAMKYLTGTVRVGAAIPVEDEIKAQLEGLDPTTASIRASILVREKVSRGYLGVDGRWLKKSAPTIPMGRRRG